MNKYEIINKMQNLCDTYGVFFEINKHALAIRKYCFHKGEYYKFNRTIESDEFTHPDFDLEGCVLTCEKKIKEKLAELDKKRGDSNDD